jgi:hypothetical protein
MTRPNIIADGLLLIALSCCLTGDSAWPEVGVAAETPRSTEEPSYTCEAVVRVVPSTVDKGEPFDLSCTFRCTEGSIKVFNPFLAKPKLLPARLVIESTDKEWRRELLSMSRDDDETSRATQWLHLRAGNSCGRVFRITGTSGREMTSGSPPCVAVDIPPGRYSIQLMYSHWAVGVTPTSGDESSPQKLPGYTDEQMGSDFVVSEKVYVTIK